MLKEFVFVLLTDLERVVKKGVGDVVGRHSVKQEFIVAHIDITLFFLEASTYEVPEPISDQSVKVLHLNNIFELSLDHFLTVAEYDACQNVFL